MAEIEKLERIEKEIQELKENNSASKENSKFAAIGQSLVEIMPSPASSKLPGQDVYGWGRDNKYPDYLYNLTQTSSTFPILLVVVLIMLVELALCLITILLQMILILGAI